MRMNKTIDEIGPVGYKKVFGRYGNILSPASKFRRDPDKYDEGIDKLVQGTKDYWDREAKKNVEEVPVNDYCGVVCVDDLEE